MDTPADVDLLALTSYREFVTMTRLHRTPSEFVALLKQWLDLPDRTV